MRPNPNPNPNPNPSQALARTCTFKPLPTEAQLRECRALTVPQFYQQGGRSLLKPLDWQHEELAERGPLGPALTTLIEIITDALDINRDGVITKAELKKCASSVSDVQVAAVGRE